MGKPDIMVRPRLAHLLNQAFVVVDVGGINIYILAGGQVVSSRDPVSRDPSQRRSVTGA